jgi:D-beta-D-heptose 7-phosphate kinase/D-beta-D-heptose 1-phosphate adenosyltransferase
VDQLRGCRVLVIGDVMVDEYMKGDVSRISPEAPVPVLEVRSHELALGGAGNAAANIQALGGAAMLVGVIGEDDTARQLDERLRQHGIARHLVSDTDRPTSKKTRFVAQGQQIVRVDHERRSPVSGGVESQMMHTISNAMASAQACVLSDYAKGAITPAIARHAIEAARVASVPVIVDPKQRDFTVYAGATVITPNLHELDAASRGIHDVEAAATSLLTTVGGAALLVTRSAEGMTLFRSGQASFHVPAVAKEVFDVTGAGDTVVATIALALAASLGLEIAVELASVAAAIAVSKRGTSTVSPAELAAALEA